MNYATLKASVRDWANRADISDALMGTFLELAEQRIYVGTESAAGLSLQCMLQTVPSFTPGVLPTGWASIERVTALVGGYKVPLEYRTSDQISTRELLGGMPTQYTVRGNALVVDSTAPGTVELLYYGRLASPSADADENAAMAAYPSVYLYGMLVEVASWLRDQEMMAQVAALFSGALKTAQRADEDARRGSVPLRIVSDQRVRA